MGLARMFQIGQADNEAQNALMEPFQGLTFLELYRPNSTAPYEDKIVIVKFDFY